MWVSALLASMVPLAVFLFMQIRIRSFLDFNNAVFGLLYALISASVFQVIIKWLIGGLRPHFLEVCRPRLERGAPLTGNGFGHIMYDRKICTNPNEHEVNQALQSFPSGHTTAAFAGFGTFDMLRSLTVTTAEQDSLPLPLPERQVEGLLRLSPGFLEARCPIHANLGSCPQRRGSHDR
jgi:membrane-associated phospholipid phosphatase